MAEIDDHDIDLLDFLSKDDHHDISTPSQHAQRGPGPGAHDRTPTISEPSNTQSRQNSSAPSSTSAQRPTTVPSSHRSGNGILNASNPHPANDHKSQISNISNPIHASKTAKPPVADFTEAYSGLRVRNRLLSTEDMRVRMKGRKVYRLEALRIAPLRALESQDASDAWATLGVLVSKSPRRQAANGGSYSIWTLSDLSRKDNDLSVFLFQEALGSHWTVCEGTLLAIVGVKVLPPKAGDASGKGRLAVSVDTPWQIHKVGMAMDYGLCKGKRKDGKPCTMPVNKAEGGYCEFHVVAAFNRAQRQGQDTTRSKPKNGSGGHSLQSMLMGNAAPGRMMASIAARCIPTASVPAPRSVDILGARARCHEGVGGAACFSTAAAASRAGVIRPPSQVKILRPTAMRAAGRTTVLSSIPTGGSKGKGVTQRDGGGVGPSPPQGNVKARKTEDLLLLPWAYGGEDDSSTKPIGTAASADRKRARDVGEQGGGEGSGGKGRRIHVQDSDAKAGERKRGALDLDPLLHAEQHPSGRMNGSVPVPGESNVYKKLAERFNIRPGEAKSEPVVREMARAQVEMSQRRVMSIAQQRGITLAPADPNALNSRRSILGNSKGGKLGMMNSNTLLNAVKGKGCGKKTSDPLALKVKTMSAVEKELLLRRVSKYAGLAEEERANEADKNMQRLEQREAMADKAEEVTKMTVTVWNCLECKKSRDYFSKRCRDLGHEQKGAKAIMRFFECTNCRKRTKCTKGIPQTGCEGCGKHDAWKRCGARPGRGPAEGPRDKQFVAAVSEWTHQRDLSLAAPDFR